MTKSHLTTQKTLDGLEFSGFVRLDDLYRICLDPIDRDLLRTIDLTSPIHDQLLVLEMLFRRMAEQL